MAQENKCRWKGGGGAQFGGTLWFIGWLFTIAFAKLGFWQAVLAIIIWPWFLGGALR